MAYYSNQTDTMSIDEKIRNNRAQVNDLTNVMHQNLQKVMERDINLTNLQENADNLNYRAEDFHTTTRKTKRWFIWKNTKWTIILILTILLIIVIIALGIGLGVGLAKNNSG
jgi:hypothetical protein